jgi:uncharacterized Zn-binding protein involved in type VI secretion
MPAVVRIGDSLSTGHTCAATTTLGGANQSSVYANGILVAVVGAPTVSHPFPPAPACAPHVAYLNVGSTTVYVEGLALGRIGDSADAGAMTSGSPTVFAGG